MEITDEDDRPACGALTRNLEVSIFNTLQNNLPRVDFSQVLPDIMTIADEVDSQLKQAMHSYEA